MILHWSRNENDGVKSLAAGVGAVVVVVLGKLAKGHGRAPRAPQAAGGLQNGKLISSQASQALARWLSEIFQLTAYEDYDDDDDKFRCELSRALWLN